MYRYFGSIAVGTPPVAYDVVLDTGSADLWLVDSQCTQNCGGTPPYSPSSSSTFANVNKPFAITYGSGQVSGYLAQDVVQMAGFRVQNQSLGMFKASSTDCSMTPTSGLCDQVSDGFLIQPVSGLMGLAWQAQSSAGVKPFWQALYESNVLDEPLMAFYLTRFRNVTGAQAQEPGGVFTLGLPKVSQHRFSELIMPA
jgi:cathepsin D